MTEWLVADVGCETLPLTCRKALLPSERVLIQWIKVALKTNNGATAHPIFLSQIDRGCSRRPTKSGVTPREPLDQKSDRPLANQACGMWSQKEQRNYIMRIFALAVLAVTAFASAPSFAQDAAGQVYINGGYNHFQTKTADTGTVNGRIGYQITPNFAVEGEGGFGVNDDKVNGVTVKNRGTLGAFAVASAPVAERLSLIGRAGYVHQWGEAKTGAVKVKDDDGSFAVGVGGQYMLDDANGIRVDYTRYTEGKGSNGYAVSYVRKF